MLVNNASGQYFVPAESIAAKGWAAVMRLNVEGTYEWAERRIAVVAAAIGRFDTESLRKYPEVVTRAPRARYRCSAWARCRSSAGSSRCWPGPLGRALSGSVVTLGGAADNWFGPWPPPSMLEDSGTVPTEERR